MKHFVAAVLLLGVLSQGTALAQTYTISSSTQPYVPLTGATNVTPSNTDEGHAVIPLGFTFPYYGQTFTSVIAQTNGILLFPPNTVCTAGFNSLCYANSGFPLGTRTFHNIIAGWWDDLDANDPAAAIRYFKPSASEIVIEYYKWGYYAYSSSDSFTFQIKLNASGLFQIHYGTHTGTTSNGSTSVGFENETGTLGANVLACNPNCTGGSATSNWPTDTLYTIGQPVQPDLVVQAVNLSNMINGASSLDFTVAPTFRNFGQNDANGFLWKAYLSTDRFLNLTGANPDILVFSATTPLSVAGLSTGSASEAVSINPKPAPGQYYVLVEADSSNLVVEASETNNVGSTTSYFTQGIDLVATSISGPGNSGPGNTINVTVKYFNQGTDPAGLMQYKIYLSADTTLGAGDFPLYTGTKTMSGGQTVDEQVSLVVPQSVPGGEFHYLLEIDSDKSVAEASETNNVAASSSKVTMQQADLVIESIDFVDAVTDSPIRVGYFGQQGRLRVRMRNAGGANAVNFKIGVAISTDANLSLLSDTMAHDEPVAMLAAGSSATLAFNFDIPLKNRLNQNFATGNYYLFGILDSFGQITELSKNNNNLIVAGPVNLRAPAQDYTVSRVDAPASAAVGEVAPVFRVIKNIGNVTGSEVSYRFYASANDIITPDDIPLSIIGAGGAATESATLTLAVGADDTRTDFVKLPAAMPPGTYYLGCIVDPGKLVTELDESNNALASGSTVQVAAAALRIATAQLPDGTTDRPYHVRLVAVGEQGTSTWSVDLATGTLPEGLTLAADGAVSGTPTSPSVSAFTVVLQSGARQAAARLVLRVLPPTAELEVTTRALPPVVNSPSIPYQGTLGAAGGVKPYSWKVTSGTLPKGVSMSAEGVFSGTAQPGVTVGETVLTFEVQDSVGSRAHADLKFRVVVPGALLVKNLVVPDSLVNYDYLTDLSAQNADGSPLATPLVWTLAAGSLPDGLYLSTQSGERGLISGKPLVAGTYAFSLQVEDAKGRADVADFILRVFPVRFRVSALNLPTVLHPDEAVDFAFTSGANSATAVGFSMYGGALPPGLTLSPEGQVTGTVASENAAGIYNFVVQAKDTSGGSGLGAFTLEVTNLVRPPGCSAAPGAGGWLALLLLGLPLWLAGRRRRGAASWLAMLSVLVLPLGARAQSVDYQLDGPNPVSGYVTLTGGDLTQINSYTGQSVSLPFTFKFYGQTYGSVTATMHGYLVFAGGDDGTSGNMGIPHTNTYSWYPQTFIAPWWDTLAKTTGSTIRAQTVGTAPNRRTIIDWKDVVYSGTSTKFSFQVQLFEGTHQIRFAYGATGPASASASVGIMKGTGPSVGLPGKSCTTASSGNCTTGDFPANQAIDFLLPPDLTVEDVTGDPTAYAGVNFRATAMLKNLGGRKATAAKVRFHLGTGPAFDPSYPVLGDSAAIDLPTGDQQLVTSTAPIPAGTAAGSYFVIAKADPEGTVSESNEANNLAVPLLVKVGPPTPDLVVSLTSTQTSASKGGQLPIHRIITNSGNAAVASSINYTYLVSDNAVVSFSDRAITPPGQLASLGVGASSSQDDSITLPTDLPAGKYWIGLCVDYDPGATPVSSVTEINEVNNCATATSGFVLNTGELAILTTTLPGASQFSPFGLRLQASGGDGQYTWSQSAGLLPPGMTLSADGDLSGTPSKAGTFSIEVKVASAGEEKSASLQLAVTGANLPLAIVDQELPVAEFSRVYSAYLVAVGGKPPYQWTLKAESRLPVGLALATDGHLEGRATDAGEYPFTVVLTDGAGATDTKDLRVRVVTPSSMHIATSRLQLGYLRKDYLQPLQAVGGKAPYSWSVVKFQQLAENPTEQPGKPLTTIPDGFGIKVEQDPSGQFMLRGAPGKAGLFALTLRVQDGSVVPSEDITTLALRISYEEALAITTTALPDAFVGHSYLAKLSHNGGSQVQDIQFSVPCVKQVAANLEDYGCAPSEPTQVLPPGLLFGADGQITGTPFAPTSGSSRTSPVVFSFLVKVTDAEGRQDVRSLSIKVRPDFGESNSGCSGVPLAPSLSALLAVALLALRARRR